MASVDLDAVEWGEELVKASSLASKAAASASRAFWGGRTDKARTTLVLRHELADFVREHGPRFTVQIDASGLRMRLTPDNAGGKFEFTEFKSVAMFRLGHVTRWPDCAVATADVEAVVHKESIVVTFPGSWLAQGETRLLSPPKADPNEMPAGVRRVLNVLCDRDSVSHSYIPSALEVNRQDAARWVAEAKQWLARLRPGVALVDKNNSFYLSKFDRTRVREILDAQSPG